MLLNHDWWCWKNFFDVIVQLKEIDPDAYYKVLKELGYEDNEKET